MSRSHVDDGDPLTLRALRFLNEPGQVVWVAGKQNDWMLQFQRRDSNDSVNRVPMPRKAGLPEQFPSFARYLGADRHDVDPGYHAMHSRIARTYCCIWGGTSGQVGGVIPPGNG